MTRSSFLNQPKQNTFSDRFIELLMKESELLIKASLKEDLDELGDVTSAAIMNNGQQGEGVVFAKQNGVFCGGFIAKELYEKLDPQIQVTFNAQEGDLVNKGQEVIKINGSLNTILIGERSMLNFISRLSGIATLTRKFVEIAERTTVKILDTRKTMPGWRYLDKYAVKIGGGENHRIGLFDMFLIKENHITAAGGISNAVKLCREFMKRKNINLKIEVETKNLAEVQEAVNCTVDRIMLDNMNLEQIKQAVSLVNKQIEIEISGGVNLDNFYEFTQIGVNYISIGQLTHSATAFDYSLILSNNLQ